MRWIRRHPVLASLAFVLLLVVGFVAGCGIVVWTAAHHDDASEIDRADAIVVLGAAQYDGEPSPVLAGRLDHAALLFEQGRADRVLVLGAGSRATGSPRRRPAGTTSWRRASQRRRSSRCPRATRPSSPCGRPRRDAGGRDGFGVPRVGSVAQREGRADGQGPGIDGTRRRLGDPQRRRRRREPRGISARRSHTSITGCSADEGRLSSPLP